MARVAANLFEEECDGIRVRRFGKMAGFGVAALGERGLGRRGRSYGHGYLRAPDFGEEAVEKLRPGFSVPESSGDAEDLQFGAAQGEREGEGIVDVVSDVGIDDYLFG